MVFYSLIENDWSDMLIAEMCQNDWKCLNCGITDIFSSIQRLQHQSMCSKEEIKDDSIKAFNPGIQKSNKLAYACPECNKTLYLAPIEILKHKKQH